MQERQQNRIQELKLSLPNKKLSTYDSVFKRLQPLDQSNFNIKMYDQIPLAQSLQLSTQYETSYRTPKPQQQENFKPSYNRDPSEMMTLTSYKQDYFNWKPAQTERVGPQRGQSTGALPFIGKTSYQDNFRATNCEPTESAKKKSLGPFASSSSMIFKEALSKIHYPGYTFEDLPLRKQNSSHIQSNGSYDGQFKTTFKTSFAHKVCLLQFIIILYQIPQPKIDIGNKSQYRKLWKKSRYDKMNILFIFVNYLNHQYLFKFLLIKYVVYNKTLLYKFSLSIILQHQKHYNQHFNINNPTELLKISRQLDYSQPEEIKQLFRGYINELFQLSQKID